MKLVLERGGGIAGLRRPPLEIDTATLAATDRDRLDALIAAAQLEALPATLGADTPDQLGYALSVTGDDGRSRTIELSLDAAPPSLRALISELRRVAAARSRPAR